MEYSSRKKPKYEVYVKKIRKLYENYGINTSDMSDDELDRLYHQYKEKKGELEKDLKESEKWAKVFKDQDLI